MTILYLTGALAIFAKSGVTQMGPLPVQEGRVFLLQYNLENQQLDEKGRDL